MKLLSRFGKEYTLMLEKSLVIALLPSVFAHSRQIAECELTHTGVFFNVS